MRHLPTQHGPPSLKSRGALGRTCVAQLGAPGGLLVAGVFLTPICIAVGLTGIFQFSQNQPIQRLLISSALGLATYSAITTVGVNAVQWGLTSGTTAPEPTGWTLGALLGAALVATIGWVSLRLSEASARS